MGMALKTDNAKGDVVQEIGCVDPVGAGHTEVALHNPLLVFLIIRGYQRHATHHLRPPNTGNPEETERAAIASGNLEEA